MIQGHPCFVHINQKPAILYSFIFLRKKPKDCARYFLFLFQFECLLCVCLCGCMLISLVLCASHYNNGSSLNVSFYETKMNKAERKWNWIAENKREMIQMYVCNCKWVWLWHVCTAHDSKKIGLSFSCCFVRHCLKKTDDAIKCVFQ